MRHDDWQGVGRNDEVSFRCVSGPLRHGDGGRELWHKLARYFVVAALLSSSVFYGAKLLVGHQAEVMAWLHQYTDQDISAKARLAAPTPSLRASAQHS